MFDWGDLQSGQVKGTPHSPPPKISSMNLLFKVQSAGGCRFQIHLCIPAFILSSEFTHEVVLKFLTAQFSLI